ncbi:hypothetical protein Ddye_026445 [Dipteronia dyeriana]|uniref:Uncharacterized protein n=1 Tax=Dipteronia dyeriana TaxID=168575 RepID=A0AAD9TNA5_9ROSI|nr:hypothetical protein Ddye_026445 [Dipteronia dyeriana]
MLSCNSELCHSDFNSLPLSQDPILSLPQYFKRSISGYEHCILVSELCFYLKKLSFEQKLEQEFEEQKPDRKFSTVESDHTDQELLQDISSHVATLNSAYSSDEANRAAAKHAPLFSSKDDLP